MSVDSPREAVTIMTKMVLAHDTNVAVPGKAFTEPDVTQEWARLSFVHANAGQASLANVIGQRKFTSTGAVLVECFYPFGKPGEAYDYAQGFADVFEGKEGDGGIWFRDVTVQENTAKDKSGWFRLNVVADFVYDRHK